LASIWGLHEEQRLVSSRLSLWEYALLWYQHLFTDPLNSVANCIIWEPHSSPCPSLPGHHRWQVPGKRWTDFGKIKFGIKFQLSLCSTTAVLETTKFNEYLPKTLAFTKYFNHHAFKLLIRSILMNVGDVWENLLARAKNSHSYHLLLFFLMWWNVSYRF
jgi:hypothetical protein